MGVGPDTGTEKNGVEVGLSMLRGVQAQTDYRTCPSVTGFSFLYGQCYLVLFRAFLVVLTVHQK